jgi:V-type H+-transporting ATPase subunit a
VASNELAFFNSLKMKVAVILGVLQMIFGIVIRGMNNIYFNNFVDFCCEFIPMIIFMTSLFGYMILMIFIKWGTDWSVDPSKAPSIITTLMNIFLKGGSVDHKPLWGGEYTQETFHFFLLIIALICIPILLFPKPIILYLRSKNRPQGYHSIEEHKDAHGGGHEAESFANLFIHQAIETIEFTLGCVSNTASYLRLWALSLAHAQLAKVFFQKALLGPIQSGNLVFVILGFFIFANITFAVLMCMDLMECFLHTLRLHWVEFQNKFYKADGYAFVPFSFKNIVEN